MPTKPISDTELEVLKVLWELDPAPVRDVQAALDDRGQAWAYTTVQTLLARLETKGYITIDKSSVPHVFRAAISRERLIRHQLTEVARKVCDGRATPLVLSLVQSQHFSREDIDRFRTMLDELEAEQDAKRPRRRKSADADRPSER